MEEQGNTGKDDGECFAAAADLVVKDDEDIQVDGGRKTM